MRTAVLLILLATVSVGCHPTDSARSTGTAGAHGSDPFTVVALADSLAAHVLWPGFDPRTTPVAVYDGSRTLLFRHPHPPAGFQPLAGHAGVAAHSGRDSAVTANTTTTLAGVPTATLMPPGDSATTTERAGVLIHEAFHVFQRSHHPGWTANEADLFTYPVTDAQLLTLRRLETEALRRALSANGQDQAACWAEVAMELRHRRFADLPANAVAYERGIEWNEGLATYVEQRATGAPDSAVLPAQGFAPDQVRQRAYRSGLGIARVLDRLAPGWQATLEHHDSIPLDSLFIATIPMRAGLPCSFTAAERDSVSRIAAADEAALSTRLAGERQRFLARPGWRLVVMAPAVPLFPQGFDPLNVQLVAPGKVLHGRFLKLGNDAGTVEVMGRAALTEAAGAHPLFSGVRTLTVTGLPAAPVIARTATGMTLEADGVTANLHGGMVDTTGDTLTLRLHSDK